MTIDGARERLVTARIRWNPARPPRLDDDGSDIPDGASNRRAWAQAQRALEAAEVGPDAAIMAHSDEA